jgi:hypothetical protein
VYTHLHWVEVLDVLEVDIIAVQEGLHISRIGVCLCRTNNCDRLELDCGGEFDGDDQLRTPAVFNQLTRPSKRGRKCAYPQRVASVLAAAPWQ